MEKNNKFHLSGEYQYSPNKDTKGTDYDVKNKPNNYDKDKERNKTNNVPYNKNNKNKYTSDDYFNDNYSDRRYNFNHYIENEEYTNKYENFRTNYDKNINTSQNKITKEKRNDIHQTYTGIKENKIGIEQTETNKKSNTDQFNSSIDGLPIELNNSSNLIIQTNITPNATVGNTPITNNNITCPKDLISSIIDRSICKKNLEENNKHNNNSITNNVPSKMNAGLNKSQELKRNSLDNLAKSSNFTKISLQSNNNQINSNNKGNNSSKNKKKHPRRNSMEKRSQPTDLLTPRTKRFLTKSQDSLTLKREETREKIPTIGVPIKKEPPPIKREHPMVNQERKRKEIPKEGMIQDLFLRQKVVRRVSNDNKTNNKNNIINNNNKNNNNNNNNNNDQNDNDKDEEEDPWRDVKKTLLPKNREFEKRDQKKDFNISKNLTLVPNSKKRSMENTKENKTAIPTNTEIKKNYARKEPLTRVPKKELPTPTPVYMPKTTTANKNSMVPPKKRISDKISEKVRNISDKNSDKIKNISEKKRVHSYALTNEQLKSYCENGFEIVKGRGGLNKDDVTMGTLLDALKDMGGELPAALYGGYVGALEDGGKSVKMEGSGKILPIEYFVRHIHCDILNGKNTTMGPLNAYFLFKNQKKMMSAETIIEQFFNKKDPKGNFYLKKGKQEDVSEKDSESGDSIYESIYESDFESDSESDYESSAKSPSHKKVKTTLSKKEKGEEREESPQKKAKTKVSSSSTSTKSKNSISSSSKDNDMLRIELKKPKHNETILFSFTGQDNALNNKKDVSASASSSSLNSVVDGLQEDILLEKKDPVFEKSPLNNLAHQLIVKSNALVDHSKDHSNNLGSINKKDLHTSKSLDEISLHPKDNPPLLPIINTSRSMNSISLNPISNYNKENNNHSSSLPVINRDPLPDPLLLNNKDFLSDFDEISRKFWSENFGTLKFVSWDKFFPVLSNALVDISGIEESQAKLIAQNMKPKLVSKFDTVGTHNLKNALNGSDFLSFIQNELQNMGI